ncbi:MAG: dihydropyrimidinase [Acidobacteria bacterium]|nr:dihydropyrimidinase [Acidobacteriota bacterium]
MPELDLVVRNGTVVTSSDRMACDIGIVDGKIAALSARLDRGKQEIDATGLYVLPGGVEGHCHIEQRGTHGVMTADDFYTGTVSAVFGGTTTVLPFAAQGQGESLRRVVEDYAACARPKAVIDYGFHLIIADPTTQVLEQELPSLIQEGFTSFKIYMTYDRLRLDDLQVLEVFAAARELGAFVMVHAENHDMIRWLRKRLLERGHVKPRYHAISHPRVGEGEAANRAIALSRLIDIPILIVHVSCEQAMVEIRKAQTAGLKVFAETCPQYLCLTAKDLDREAMEGAKFCCSPPLRDLASQEAIWRGIRNGTFQVFSSDHAPYRFDETGKFHAGPNPHFTQVANGLPGIELRAPLLFSEGVGKGRIDLHQFVALTSTNPAKIYGLYPRKGSLAVGGDADIALWDPHKEVTVTHDILHDACGYTPYEGMRIKGWPVTVLSRGRVAVQDGQLKIARGGGCLLKRELSTAARPLGVLEQEMDPAKNFGASVLSSRVAQRT